MSDEITTIIAAEAGETDFPVDAEGEAAFNAALADKTEEAGEESSKKESEDKASKAEPDDSPADEIFESPDIDALVKELDEAEPTPSPKEEPTPPSPSDPPRAGEKIPVAEQYVDQVTKYFFGDLDLPKSLKEFSEDYSDIATGVQAIVAIAVDRAVFEAVSELRKEMMAVKKELEPQVKEISGRLLVRDYWADLEKEFPGAENVAITKEFKDWLSARDEKIRRLARSVNPKHGAAVLSIYREQVRNAELDEKATVEKKKKTEVLGSVLKHKATPSKPPVQNDEEKLFENYFKSKG